MSKLGIVGGGLSGLVASITNLLSPSKRSPLTGSRFFYRDPGSLSAAFVAERGAQLLTPPPPNTYIVG
jgi:hypothetical protein